MIGTSQALSLFYPTTIAAIVSWPKFSFTAFKIVSALQRQGIAPKTCLDVGGNVGQFAVAAAKFWPHCRVESFEPVPDCAVKLRKNCGRLSINVHEVAVGDRDGEVPIHVNAHRHSSSILNLGAMHREAFPFATEETTKTVKLVRLDSIFRNHDFERPVLLKLDIQGYEPEALRGAAGILSQIDYVLVETSFKPMYEGEMLFTEILSLMQSFGFRFLRPIDWLEDPRTGEVLQMDALFAKSAST